MESVGRVEDQRVSSEYYSHIDESQIREIEIQHSDMVDVHDLYFELDYTQMRDDAIEEEGTTNYEHCTTSGIENVGIPTYEQCTTFGPRPVHTYEGRTATFNQEGASDDPNPYTLVRNDSYLELDAYQMRDDGTESKDITTYEHCTTFGPRPVHTYERRVNVINQEEKSDDLEPKVSNYAQLKSTHKSKPPKPPVYKRLQIERGQPIISP